MKALPAGASCREGTCRSRTSRDSCARSQASETLDAPGASRRLSSGSASLHWRQRGGFFASECTIAPEAKKISAEGVITIRSAIISGSANTTMTVPMPHTTRSGFHPAQGRWTRTSFLHRRQSATHIVLIRSQSFPTRTGLGSRRICAKGLDGSLRLNIRSLKRDFNGPSSLQDYNWARIRRSPGRAGRNSQRKPQGFMTQFRLGDRTIELRDGESVLDALLRAGAPTAFSCRKGTCHTCLMRCSEGTPPKDAQRGLPEELVATKHFLPCIAHPTEALTLAEADTSTVWMDAIVAETRRLSPTIVELLLEPAKTIEWKPGQFINVEDPNGVIRSYSIASRAQDDYFLHLQVEHIDGGKVSPWLHSLNAGDMLRIQGPFGHCHYAPDSPEQPLLLVGTGTGLAPLLGVLKEALGQGHSGPIELHHAARSPEESYAAEHLEKLAEAHGNLSVNLYSDGRNIIEDALPESTDRRGTLLYVAGNPAMVFGARSAAVAAGIFRKHVRADPFEPAEPIQPEDHDKLEAWPTDPELWAALNEGKVLRTLLEEFYDQVYEDELLSPFFHHATKERAISKQYEFLYAVFTGEIVYFGLKPFNAHHWMVISDELFDYREELFEAVVRRHLKEEKLIRRWMAFQELFRREIVKPLRRGLYLDGVEQPVKGYSDEVLEIDMVCDGCVEEMPAGSTGRLHEITGQLYCERCSAG